MSADGVPDGARWTPVPDAFFGRVMPAVEDLATLKVALHVLWRVKRRQPGDPPALRLCDMASDTTLVRGLDRSVGARTEAGPSEGDDARAATITALLTDCVDTLVELGWLLLGDVQTGDGTRTWVWPNIPESRRHHQRWLEGGIVLPDRAVGRTPPPVERGNVFALYEDNIGVISPLIAERLAEAEASYPSVWLEDAIRTAVENNVRRWSYISAILERWARDGRGDEADPRRGKEGRDGDPQGPYADVVQH